MTVFKRFLSRVLYHLLNKFSFKIIYSGKYVSKFNFIRQFAFRLTDFHLRIIKLHITSSCNLHCKDCYNNNRCSMPECGDLEAERIFSLLDELNTKSVKNRFIRLDILGGEPLLRKDFFDIVSYAKSKAKIKKVQVFTNGTLIDDSVALKMKEAGVDVAIVTLHSHKKELHESITQCPGSWEQAVNAIRVLRNAGIATYSFTVMMACNVGELREIELFSGGLGAKSIYYPYIQQQEEDGLAVKSQDAFQGSINWIYKKSEEYKDRILKMLDYRCKACFAFVSSISIRANGVVSPCPFLDLELGNIKSEKFYEIVHNAHFNKELINFLSIPVECKACSVLSYCGGGCKAFRYNFYRDYKSKDIHCKGPYKEKIPLERLGEYLPYLS